jgi:hypothetical protein
MPPHLEVDSHHDDWHPQLVALSNDEPSSLSPLFRSVELPPRSATSCGLDRRMSDPDFTSAAGKQLVLKENPKKDVIAAAAPAVVSRITAIIGPESAYVKKTTAAVATPAATKAAATPTKTKSTPTPVTTKTVAQTTKSKQSPPSGKAPVQQKSKSKKSESKPIFLRASHYVSKKGWKVVKSLPKKVTSSVGSVKVPGHNRNVV